MFQAIRSFMRRFKQDSELDERLRRNQNALKKKRMKAGIPADAGQAGDPENPPQPTNPLTAE